MAKNILYSLPNARKAKQEEDLSGQLNTEIEEIDTSESDKKLARSKCEICVIKKPLEKSVAVFVCFVCEVYMCAKCLLDHRSHDGDHRSHDGNHKSHDGDHRSHDGDHRSHDGKRLRRMENETERTNTKRKVFVTETEKMRREDEYGREKEEEESDRRERISEGKRMEEQIDKERYNVLDDLFNESEEERKDKFDKYHVSIYDRVKVKHELDVDNCRITGLCGLDNKNWVVCDYQNSCIKVFSLGTNVLQRYIRFNAQPWDVTEIHLKQRSAEPNLVSGSSSAIPVPDLVEQCKECFLAVTLLGKCQIIFIDLGRKPALTQTRINTEERCYSIEFHDDKIFTVCRREELPSLWSVYVKCMDGNTLMKFDVKIFLYFGPRLAVTSGRVYLTDYLNNTVQCRNIEGQVISEITIKGSDPVGISVDLSNNVYVCAWGHDKVYKLDLSLTRYNSVLDKTTNDIERCHALCYYKDKLFISHHWLSSLENFVTVVRLL